MRGYSFAATLLLAVVGFCHEMGAGFQAPLTSVEASLTTNGSIVTVHFRVFDPDLAVWQEGQRRYDGSPFAFWVVENLTAKDGIVAWQAVNLGQFSSHATEAGFAVYDPARAAWVQAGRSFSGDATVSWVISGLTTAGGVVMWQATPAGPLAEPAIEIHFATYDPSRGAWMLAVHAYAGTAVNFWNIDKLVLANGTVAWQATEDGQFSSPNTEVGCALFDPALGAWIETVRRYAGTIFDSWTTTSLTLVDGIVAWRAELSGQSSTQTSEIGFTLFDSSRGSWMNSSRRYEGNTLDPWTITNFSVGSQTVQWTARRSTQSSVEVRGYNQATGLWYAGPNKAFARFWPSVFAGNAPLRVWLADLSIGGSRWMWDFGDGVTNGQRSPYHVFVQPGIFTVTQTVSGPGGTNSAARKITVFGQGPPRFDTAGAQLTNGEFHVRLDGLTGRGPLIVWASPDLRNWKAILTNAPTPGSMEFVDATVTNFPARFFRASEQ